MHIGLAISGSMHAAFVLVAIFGLPYFQPDKKKPEIIAEVTLISAAEFDRRDESVPDVPLTDTVTLEMPGFGEEFGEAPEADTAPVASAQDFVEDPSARDTDPDLSALIEALAQPEVAVDVGELTEADETVAALSVPQMPGMDQQNALPSAPSRASPAAPRQLPRLDSFDAPAPPRPVPPSDRATPATAEAETAAAVPQEAETAPPESSSATSPEEESGAEDGTAMRTASRPRTRPRNFDTVLAVQEVARAAAAQSAAREAARNPATPETPDTAEADAIAAAVRAAAAQSANPPADPGPNTRDRTSPAGIPLTAGEKDGLRLAVQKCWNVPAGLENASDLKVVVSVELGPDGKVVGQPRLIDPRSADRPEIRTAFEAARRAILLCGRNGFELPRDKYEQWKDLEVSFDPRGMLARW